MQEASDAKTVVVTGAATGIGAAVTDKLVERGHAVVALDVAEQPKRDGVTNVMCDLSDPQSIDSAVELLPGTIDAVANVAGIAGPEPRELVVAVNFLGLRHLSESLADRITPGGSIVSVSSTAGRSWERRREVVDAMLDTPDFAAGLTWARENEGRWAKDPYTFSKQCVTLWTKRMSRLGAQGRVRVNSVSPGSVETQLTPAFRAQMGEEFSDWRLAQIDRAATPVEMADPVIWFAVGDSHWVNGADLIVDRGLESGMQSGWVDIASAPGR